MKCKECGKEKVWMEYTGVWACPDDCTGSYGIHSLLRLGVNLSPNKKFQDICWKDKNERQQ